MTHPTSRGSGSRPGGERWSSGKAQSSSRGLTSASHSSRGCRHGCKDCYLAAKFGACKPSRQRPTCARCYNFSMS